MPPSLYELPIVLLMNVEWIAIQCYVPYVMHFVIVSCLMFHIAIKWFWIWKFEYNNPMLYCWSATMSIKYFCRMSDCWVSTSIFNMSHMVYSSGLSACRNGGVLQFMTWQPKVVLPDCRLVGVPMCDLIEYSVGVHVVCLYIFYYVA